MRVIVGVSGGVDSAVTALLLQQAGYEVTGVTMRIGQMGRYGTGGSRACFTAGAAEVAAAGDLCRQLNIPWHCCDCATQFKTEVLDYFCREYLAACTPNPCIVCNAVIKFDILPTLAEAAGIAFDCYATGHYARIREHEGRFQLLRASDESKDQSYFLYRLKQQQLARHLFPLGNLTKSEVRHLAAAAGLQVARKVESQDFYDGAYSELLGVPDQPGEIVDTAGCKLGEHSGFWKFTVGQRKGLGLSHPEPLYVTALDACHNRVVVAPAAAALCYSLIASDCNWVSLEPPRSEIEVELKVRSTGTPHRGVTLLPLDDKSCRLTFDAGIAGVAPGQSAVFYRDDLLLGGGIIRESR